MKRIESLRDIQKIELNILEEIDKFCSKNSIYYSLAFGTMIGAIRHKGFIPWDDDIDLLMTRENYNRFIEILKTDGNKLGKYDVLVPDCDNAFMPYIKVCDNSTLAFQGYIKKEYLSGLWVDVFPLDYAYESKEDNEVYINKRAKDLEKLVRSVSNKSSSWYKTILLRLYNKFNVLIGKDVKYWSKRCLNFPQNSKSTYMGHFSLADTHTLFHSSLFDEYINVEFEGKKYKCFKNYDEILKIKYGDYMKIPKEQERHYHHIEAYYID